jgi:hypothetical protein
VAGATIGAMPTREQLHRDVDAVSEDRLNAAHVVIDPVPEPNGAEPKKVGRLSFAAIAASGTADVSERFDEYLGLAIDRRHLRS